MAHTMKKQNFFLLAIFACVFFSCASVIPGVTEITAYEKTENPKTIKKKKYKAEKFLKALDAGDLEKATAFLLGEKKTTKEEIRQFLNLALAEHFLKSFETSIQHFASVDERMLVRETKSISAETASLLLNENLSAYEGRAYEKFYMHVFNALNYYQLGNLEDALVEMRKLALVQKEFEKLYGSATNEKAVASRTINEADVMASMLGINLVALKEKIPQSLPNENRFRDSALSRYASMIFFDMYNDNNARVDAKRLKILSPDFDVENEFANESDFENGNGLLSVLSFSGLIARREEETFYFPGDVVNGLAGLAVSVLGFGPSAMIFLPPFENDIVVPAFRIKFAYPKFPTEKNKTNVEKIIARVLETGDAEELSLVENLSLTVKKDVMQAAPTEFARSIVRSILKKGAAVTAGVAALAAIKKNSDESFWTEISYAASYLSLVIALEAIDAGETADVRQCVVLPEKACAKTLHLAPGSYTVAVSYYGENNALLYTETFYNQKIEAGKRLLLESTFLRK